MPGDKLQTAQAPERVDGFILCTHVYSVRAWFKADEAEYRWELAK